MTTPIPFSNSYKLQEGWYIKQQSTTGNRKLAFYIKPTVTCKSIEINDCVWIDTENEDYVDEPTDFYDTNKKLRVQQEAYSILNGTRNIPVNTVKLNGIKFHFIHDWSHLCEYATSCFKPYIIPERVGINILKNSRQWLAEFEHHEAEN